MDRKDEMTRERTWQRWLAPLVFACVLVAIWGLVSPGVPHFLLPSPGSVVVRFVEGLTWGSGGMLSYLGVTLGEALGGCVLGAVVALPLAVLVHRFWWVSAAVNPFLGATQAIPAIALAPLLVLWVGYGWSGIVALCGLMVFFPILISTVLGLRHVAKEVVEAARMDGAGWWALLGEIEAPLALPSVLAGLRNGFTLSVTGAVVGEMVMGGNGLGMLLTVQRDAADAAGMFATIVLLCLVASAIYSLIHAWEHRSRIVASL